MTMNANIMNAICENAAQEIRKELPTFEEWYKELAEFKALEANANGILDLKAIDDEISRMDRNAFNSMVKGETVDVEKADSLNCKHNDLIAAKNFILREAHYAYTDIDNMIGTIAHHVSVGDFDNALKYYVELKGFHSDDISNPIASIDMNAIADEIRYAKRECAKLEARDTTCGILARSIAESCRDGFAIIGAVAAVAADLTIGIKVLKKILK